MDDLNPHTSPTTPPPNPINFQEEELKTAMVA